MRVCKTLQVIMTMMMAVNMMTMMGMIFTVFYDSDDIYVNDQTFNNEDEL